MSESDETRGAAAAAADVVRDADLDRLLDDVHRMASGFGNLCDLAVEIAGPLTARTSPRVRTNELELIQRLREELRGWTQTDSEICTLPIGELRILVGLASRLAGLS